MTDVPLTYVTCWCGMPFAMPTRLWDETRRDSSITYYCPIGHPIHCVESETTKQRRRAERAEQENARLAEEARLANQRAEKAKAETRRLMRRVGSGVCPCCNRTFQNVARHMKHKHPNVVPLETKQA